MNQSRQPFASKWIFVLAAVGSAAGLGNLWRFPYLAYENGGGAFLVAYVVCLFLVGATLLILETGLGQITGRAAPGAMGTVGRPGVFRYVGWLAIVMTFFITMYYVVITSWAVNYAVNAHGLPWAQHAEQYFYHDFLQVTPTINGSSHIIWPIFFGALAVYVVLYLSIRKGTTGVAAVAKWITPIPIILILLLAVNSMTLPGASIGLREYFHPQWALLLHDDVWFAAASQVFFSLSIGFGVMFAYGALLHRHYSVRYTAIAVVIGDTFVALFGGMIVYSVLGYLSYKHQLPIHEVIKGGIGLAFVVLPKALALLPALAKTISVVFYIALVGLAFTSIVSMSEAVVAAIQDARPQVDRSKVVLITSMIAFIGGIVYMRSNGILVLDIVDHYISGYVLLFIGLVEVLLIGWMYNAKRLRQQLKINTPARVGWVFEILVRFIIPLLLISLLGKEAYDDFIQPYGGYSMINQWLYGGLPILLILACAFGLAQLDRVEK